MNNRAKELILSIMFVLGIVLATSGSTYAYFTASDEVSNVVNGSTYDFLVSVSIIPIKTGNLVPVDSSSILTSLNSDTSCVDSRGNNVCSIYEIRLTNGGTAQNLTGSLVTVSSTYTSSNLKYQLYTKNSSIKGSPYVAYGDNDVINHTANTNNYFKSSGSNITFSLGNNAISSYYLVIWINNVDSNQLEDRNKTYNGSVVFSNANGTVSATFTVPTSPTTKK